MESFGGEKVTKWADEKQKLIKNMEITVRKSEWALVGFRQSLSLSLTHSEVAARRIYNEEEKVKNFFLLCIPLFLHRDEN